MSDRIQIGTGIILGILVLLLISIRVNGQEVKNLGVISNTRGIVLTHKSNRSDFVHFEIELQTVGNTNSTTIIRTNDFLTIDDFGFLEDGFIVMIVKSVYSDGSESKLKLSRFELRREEANEPDIRVITLATKTNKVKLKEILQKRKNTNSVGAPMPNVEIGKDQSSLYPNMGNPMRGGTNKTYSDHMAEYFNRKERK